MIGDNKVNISRKGKRMMKVEMYDKVLLKNGCTAYIVDAYGDSGDYEADIDMPDGIIKTDTINIFDIEKII